MTTPRVTELPRRLESTSQDTFLGTGATSGDAPLAVVLQLRPRTGLRSHRAPRARRAGRPLHVVVAGGPGDEAA